MYAWLPTKTHLAYMNAITGGSYALYQKSKFTIEQYAPRHGIGLRMKHES